VSGEAKLKPKEGKGRGPKKTSGSAALDHTANLQDE